MPSTILTRQNRRGLRLRWGGWSPFCCASAWPFSKSLVGIATARRIARVVARLSNGLVTALSRRGLTSSGIRKCDCCLSPYGRQKAKLPGLDRRKVSRPFFFSDGQKNHREAFEPPSDFPKCALARRSHTHSLATLRVFSWRLFYWRLFYWLHIGITGI